MLNNVRLFWLVVLATTLAAPALGQNRGPERQGVRINGTLKDMGRGMLQVESADGEMWLVKIADRPREISYVGTAEPAWLRPGMWVRFRGNFNRRLQADSAIDELTIFTPNEETQLGVIPQVSLGENLFSDEAQPQEVDKNAPVPCLVAGRIVSLKKNKLMVAAGQASVTVEVPEDVRIAVEVADISVAQPGDQVSIEGWKYEMVPGRAMANSVTITSDKPLAPPRPAKKNRNKKKDAEEEQPPTSDSGTDENAAETN